MMVVRLAGMGALGLFLSLTLSLPAVVTRAEETGSTGLHVGLVTSLFRDAPRTGLAARLKPLKSLLDDQTGLNCDLTVAGSEDNLAQELADGKVNLGVFHGYEFAWAREKFPKLQPLVVAVSACDLRAYIVVRRDSGLSSVTDLEGKSLALPQHLKAYCNLFLDRCCKGCGKTPQTFFGRLDTPVTEEQALDAVATGKVDAAVVDRIGLDWYSDQKSARFARLKVAEESEAFPAGVIAYCQGGLNEVKLDRFRDGLLSAHRNSRGATILGFCHIKRFDRVPADYDKALAQIIKSYPAPCDSNR